MLLSITIHGLIILPGNSWKLGDMLCFRSHNPKVRGSNPLPATIYNFNYINILRRFNYLIIRSSYFYTPGYTPHTFQVFPDYSVISILDLNPDHQKHVTHLT